MPSSSTRLEIVQQAVKQAGRSAELYATGKELLNALLRDLALKNRYSILRKIGSSQTLSSGSATAELPADHGAGTEKIILGTDKSPLTEFDLDEFTARGGFLGAIGRPSFYFIDREAGVYRFNSIADTNYSFFPIYFKLPAAYALNTTDDNTRIWYENDLAIQEGLIYKIFQYLVDPRERGQKADFEISDAGYRAGTRPLQGGTSRIQLSSTTFRRT